MRNAVRTSAPIAATSAASTSVLRCTSLPAVMRAPFVRVRLLSAAPLVRMTRRDGSGGAEPQARRGRTSSVTRRNVLAGLGAVGIAATVLLLGGILSGPHA